MGPVTSERLIRCDSRGKLKIERPDSGVSDFRNFFCEPMMILMKTLQVSEMESLVLNQKSSELMETET